MPAITRQQAAEAAKTPPMQRVEAPELGEGAYTFVRVMPCRDLDELEAESIRDRTDDIVANLKNFRAKTLVRCLCDETGTPIYGTVADGKRTYPAADVEECANLPASLSIRAYTVAKKINDDGIAQVAKNSDADPSGVSGSGSQKPSGAPTLTN